MKIKKIKLKIYTKVQKLLEAPDKKRVDACAKKEPSRQKKEACFLYSSDWQSDNT